MEADKETNELSKDEEVTNTSGAGFWRFFAGAAAASVIFSISILLPPGSPAIEILKDNILSPEVIAAAIVLIFYASMLALVVFNKKYREAFIRSSSRFNKALSAAFGAFVGVEPSRQSRELSLERRYAKLFRQQWLRQMENSDSIPKATEQRLKSTIRKELETEYFSRKSEESNDSSSGQVNLSVFAIERATKRIESASSTVTVRGFVNLVIGVIFALGALYILRESVGIFTPEQLGTANIGQVAYLIGIRISLALIITLIAYFFLSLYRKSLEDTKYYQNELTMLESHISAVLISQSLNDSSVSAMVAKELMCSKREVEPQTSEITGSARERLLLALIGKLPELKN